jgi:hypothetical protein
MFYAIDFDSLTVESKSEQGEDLAVYVLDNELTLAIALVDSEDELCLTFLLTEMQGLHNNIQAMDEFYEGSPKEFKSEEEAAEACWKILEEYQDYFPKFTPALGKKLLKQAAKQPSDKAKPAAKKTTKATKEAAPRTRVTLNRDDSLTVVDGKCKSGSILNTIVTAIDDELCETVGDVLDYIVAKHVIPKTGELADMKFAEHNVKYFLKQGNISTGEEL